MNDARADHKPIPLNNSSSSSSISDQQTAISNSPKATRVLALSSGGGHWVQLLRLRPAFKDCDITYATVNRGDEPEVEGAKFRVIVDSNRDQKLKLILSLLSIAWTILSARPHTILSTGAAPGFFAIFIGKILGKKTIWVDSIANAEELSMSGQKAGKYVTHWLTQWEHLAKPEGPHYYGNVLGDSASEEAIANPKSRITDQENSSEQPTSISKDQRSVISDQRSNSNDQELTISNQKFNSPIRNPQSVISNKDPKSFRIFVTVGTDQHFDRMVKIIDQWAAYNPEHEIFAQIGETDYKPSHLEYSKFLKPNEFVEHVKSASLIIAHAGMGTILTALKHQKPILVMPKLARLGEHRNEHQTATAKYLSEQGKVNVAFDEDALVAALDHLKGITGNNSVGPFANDSLTIELSAFIRSQ